MHSLALKNIQASLVFLLSPSLVVLVAQKNIFFVQRAQPNLAKAETSGLLEYFSKRVKASSSYLKDSYFYTKCHTKHKSSPTTVLCTNQQHPGNILYRRQIFCLKTRKQKQHKKSNYRHTKFYCRKIYCIFAISENNIL